MIASLLQKSTDIAQDIGISKLVKTNSIAKLCKCTKLKEITEVTQWQRSSEVPKYQASGALCALLALDTMSYKDLLDNHFGSKALQNLLNETMLFPA